MNQCSDCHIAKVKFDEVEKEMKRLMVIQRWAAALYGDLSANDEGPCYSSWFALGIALHNPDGEI